MSSIAVVLYREHVTDFTDDSHPPRRNRPPGKQRIDRDKYDDLLAAFRVHGENYSAVAADCGVHWETAKRAWLKGWSSQKGKGWAQPIKTVIEQEQVQARAALQREREALVQDHRIARQQQLVDAIDASMADIIDSRAKRGKVIRGARDNSLASLIISQKLLKAAIPLADKVAEQLNGKDGESLTVFERMRLLRQLGRFAHDSVEMAQVVEEMERKALGEPDATVNVQHGLNMNLDDAKATLKEVAEVLAVYEEGDIEDVIDVTYREDGQLAVEPGNVSPDDG